MYVISRYEMKQVTVQYLTNTLTHKSHSVNSLYRNRLQKNWKRN